MKIMNTENTIENLQQTEIADLESTGSAEEWNNICDEIKKARGGQYPPDWWEVMMMSGKISGIQESWNQS